MSCNYTAGGLWYTLKVHSPSGLQDVDFKISTILDANIALTWERLGLVDYSYHRKTTKMVPRIATTKRDTYLEGRYCGIRIVLGNRNVLVRACILRDLDKDYVGLPFFENTGCSAIKIDPQERKIDIV